MRSLIRPEIDRIQTFMHVLGQSSFGDDFALGCGADCVRTLVSLATNSFHMFV